jgi:hypothetical protein
MSRKHEPILLRESTTGARLARNVNRTLSLMRQSLAAAAFLACAACGLGATPTKHEVLQAIAVMEKSVSSPEAAEAAKLIVVYAQMSDDVMVDIGPDQLPWVNEAWGLGKTREAALQSMLMAAFVAGNVKSQIKNDRAEDDTYSGWIFVIETYRRLRAKEPFQSASIEDLAKLQAEGKLLQHARDVHMRSEEGDPDAPKKPPA